MRTMTLSKYSSLPGGTGDVNSLACLQIGNPSQRIPNREAASAQDTIIDGQREFGVELEGDDEGQGGGGEGCVGLPGEVPEECCSYGEGGVGG